MNYAINRERILLNTKLFDNVFTRVVSELGKDTVDEDKLVKETELVFPDHQPSCFFESEPGIPFRGQEPVKKRLEVKIHSLGSENRFKALLTGPAGTGKTTLARIVAKRIRDRRLDLGMPMGRYFELLPSQIETKEELDVFMRQLREYDIVFIDEIHILGKNVGAEPLYHTLDDTGSPRYPLGKGEGWLEIPTTVSWIAATTEPGELDGTTGGALRRRLSPEIRLDAPDINTLAEIVHDQDFPSTADAALEIAKRSGGLPWQVILLYTTAKEFALYEQVSRIDAGIAEETFKLLGVDKYGLMPEDRSVIHVLLESPYKMKTGDKETRYKMSETALCAAAGIDRMTYKQIIQPRLMRLGFLTTVGGQCLTNKAVEIFKNES